MLKRQHLYFIGLCLTAVIWGSNFGISRWAMTQFNLETLVFLRFGLSVPLLFLFLKISEGSLKIDLRDLLKLAFIGFIGISINEIVLLHAINLTTLANSALLSVAPWPIFVAILAPLFTRERLTLRIVVGGIFALIGVTFIIVGGENGLDLGSKYMLGNLLAFSLSLIGAIFSLLSMQLMEKYSALRISTWTIFFGTIFMFPFTWGSWGQVAWTKVSFAAWSALGYNVILCTVLSFFLWNLCMKHVGATKANFYRYLVPATATVAGALFFAEMILPLQIAGGIIIIIGLVWISRSAEAAEVSLIE